MRTTKALKLALAILFTCNGIWLLAYGFGLLTAYGEAMPYVVKWAWSIPISAVFFHIAPIVWMGLCAGFSLGSAKAQVPWHLLGAALYLTAAVLLFLRHKYAAKVGVFVCLVNAVAAGVRIFVLGSWSGITSWETLERFLMFSLILLAYMYLGYFISKEFIRWQPVLSK